MGALLTAGSINTDMVVRVTRAPQAGETVTGTSFAMFGGGKGANQTLAAARSGATVSMLGALGNDAFGDARLADLERDGVDVASIRRIDEVASGVALITIESGGENRIAYVPGATGSITPDHVVEALERVRPTTILMTLELPQDSLLTLIERGRAFGATIIVNATPEPGNFRDAVAGADTLIVNESETRELIGWSGTQTDWEAAAVRLTTLGPHNIIITLGAAGALVYSEKGAQLLPPPKVSVVDTTGAGDAFCGAFAAKIAEGARIEAAARAGVVAGALATTVEGAQPSQPTREQIEAILATM